MKFEMAVTPPAIWSAIEKLVSVVAVPEQVLFRLAITQLLDAPEYSGATWAAIALVTLMLLTVVGAVDVQLHEAGQLVDPAEEQSPLS